MEKEHFNAEVGDFRFGLDFPRRAEVREYELSGLEFCRVVGRFLGGGKCVGYDFFELVLGDFRL